MSAFQQGGRREVLNPSDSADTQDNWVRGKFLKFIDDYESKRREFIDGMLPTIKLIKKYTNRYEDLNALELPISSDESSSDTDIYSLFIF